MTGAAAGCPQPSFCAPACNRRLSRGRGGIFFACPLKRGGPRGFRSRYNHRRRTPSAWRAFLKTDVGCSVLVTARHFLVAYRLFLRLIITSRVVEPARPRKCDNWPDSPIAPRMAVESTVDGRQ